MAADRSWPARTGSPGPCGRRRAGGPGRRGRDWVAAGDRAPERDRAVVAPGGLVDLVADADRRDVAGGQPAGDAQFLLHPGEPVGGTGDPDHDGVGGQLIDRVLAQPQKLGAVAATSPPGRTLPRALAGPPMTRTPQRHPARESGFPPNRTSVKHARHRMITGRQVLKLAGRSV